MEKVVMVDIDGVLIGLDYKTNANLRPVLAEALAKGIKIVPNTDTPVERVRTFFLNEFNYYPEIVIGEKGAVIGSDVQHAFLAHVSSAELRDYRAELVKIFGEFICQPCHIEIGDSVNWIRQKRNFPPNRDLLLIDDQRQQTIGFYLLCSDNAGLPQIDAGWFALGSLLAKTIKLPELLEASDFNADYGIVIMNAIGASKTTGYTFLNCFYPSAQFYMIGDGASDIITDTKVQLCAVANAVPELKRKSDFVASKPVTAGFIECLEWIMAQP